MDYFGARYYGSTMGRWLSSDNPKFSEKSDPQTWNLYGYVGNNPMSRVDFDGHNWFKINGKWEWHKGNSFEKYKSNYTHLLVLHKTGQKTPDGATIVKLRLYGNSDPSTTKPLVEGNATSGAPNIFPTRNGSYEINLNIRGGVDTNRVYRDSEGPKLSAFPGLQEVGSEIWLGEHAYNAQGPWGTQRANLNTMGGAPTHLYLHGKQDQWFWTHGCTAEKDQRVLGVIFKLDPSGIGEGNKNGKIAVWVNGQ